MKTCRRKRGIFFELLHARYQHGELCHQRESARGSQTTGDAANGQYCRVRCHTQAELLYGLARKGHPAAFTSLIREFLLRAQVLPWDSNAATVYGDLCESCAGSGITLGTLDMMSAAHAVATKSILVTHDKALSLVPRGILAVEDWVDGE